MAGSMETSTSASMHDLPVPSIPGTITPVVLGSLTNRVRYSSISSEISTINSPRRVRRRKDPVPFNVLIIGAHNSGKTSFLNLLRNSLAISLHKFQSPVVGGPTLPDGPFSNFVPHYLETEIEDERIGVTIWDSEGLEECMVDLQLREISSFLESKFEETFNEETKVVRVPGVRDTHIHAVFLLLDPVRIELNITAAWKTTPQKADSAVIGGLDENFDLQVLCALQDKTTVVPVIAKADTVTVAHMVRLKRAVRGSLKKWNLYPYGARGLDDNNSPLKENNDPAVKSQERKHYDNSDLESPTETDSTPDSDQAEAPGTSVTAQYRKPGLPFCIISPDSYEPSSTGRIFPWGLANPYNTNHCDFSRLKEMVFTEWRDELREASRELWYETWRTTRLEHAMRSA